MNKRGGHSYGTMAERVAATRGERPQLVDPTALERLKHCWILDGAGRSPALLLEWRWIGDGWHARVVRGWLVEDRWEPAEVWLPAGQLEQA
jgi:hypothetical protein